MEIFELDYKCEEGFKGSIPRGYTFTQYANKFKKQIKYRYNFT